MAKEDGVSPRDVSHSPVIEVGGERDTSINSSAAASMTEFREVKSTADDLRVELEVKNQLDKDVSRSPVIEVGGEKRAEAQAEIGAEEATFIKISISKSANLTIELETLTDEAASITAAKNKKSSTTVI